MGNSEKILKTLSELIEKSILTSKDIKNEISINARRNALERCFSNIINNGLTYGKRVIVTMQKSLNRVVILFDDNKNHYVL